MGEGVAKGGRVQPPLRLPTIYRGEGGGRPALAPPPREGAAARGGGLPPKPGGAPPLRVPPKP